MNLLYQVTELKLLTMIREKNVSKFAIERLVTKSYIISQGLMLHSPVFYLATCGRRCTEMERKQIKSYIKVSTIYIQCAFLQRHGNANICSFKLYMKNRGNILSERN